MHDEQTAVPFDPDFDTPKTSANLSPMNLFDALGGQQAFWAGVLLSVLTLMSLGFLLLVIPLLSGKTLSL